MIFRRILAAILVVFAFFACGSTALATEVVQSDNAGRHDYYRWRRWASPSQSGLSYDAEAGIYTRVEYINNAVLVETYNEDFVCTGSKTIPAELSIYGGFHSGTDYYFLIFGQTNLEENNDAEVIRIVKYDKNWNRIGHASLLGANTTVPFDAGSLSTVEYNGYLYIRTAHEMYTADDGYNHQANLTINVRIADMTITDSFYKVMNKSYGYVSHSFCQYITVDETEKRIIAADHGDASPRSVMVTKYCAEAGQDKFLLWTQVPTGDGSYTRKYVEYSEVLPIIGQKGDNNTGVELGGLAVSDSAYLTVGNTVPQVEENFSFQAQRNIFLTVTKKDMSETNRIMLTNYTDSDKVDISNPYLIRISGSRFLIMWMEDNILHCVFTDGEGKTGEKRTFEIQGNFGSCLSDCQPIMADGKVVWYVTSNTHPVFFAVDPVNLTVEESHCFSNRVCRLCGGSDHTCQDSSKDHYCDSCGKELSQCGDTDFDHACDVCQIPMGEHKAGEGSHNCGYCSGKISDCTDKNPKDHACDICSASMGKHEAAVGAHNCTYCGGKISDCADEAPKDHKCDICKLFVGEHKAAEGSHNCGYCGGKASECVDEEPKDHICDICSASMGKHEAAVGAHNCTYCGGKISDCADEAPKDHICDICKLSVGEHKAAEGSHNCGYCGGKISDCTDKNPKDHACDICSVFMGVHEAAPKSHNCDYCSNKMTDCTDEDTNHRCDICKIPMGEHRPAAGSHSCGYCGKKIGDCSDEKPRDHKCDICAAPVGIHETAEGSHSCGHCGEKMTDCGDSDTNHACDVCKAVMGEHKAAEGSHICAYCGHATSECDWVRHQKEEIGHYDTYICCHCGEWRYKVVDDDYVTAFADHLNVDHNDDWWNWSYYSEADWVTDTPAVDCDICTVCGETKDHSFRNYVSNNNATCTWNGTKTAICEHCDATDTVTEEGSSLGHEMKNPVFVWSKDHSECNLTLSCSRNRCKETETHNCVITADTFTARNCKEQSYVLHRAVYATYSDEEKIMGDIGTHDWAGATCLAAKTCGYCNETEGVPLDHFDSETDNDHICDTCDKVLNACADKDHDDLCDVCGKDMSKSEGPKPEAPKVEGVTRLAGKDRLVTSQLIADQLKVQMGVEKFENIIVASGATFADALPGSYLAAEKNAPIILTLSKQKYIDQTAAYVKANLAEGGTVYILGGESAVPALMEKALEGMNVKRVAGADRFGTNLAILKEAGVKAGDEILVCTAKEFADSLSAAATGKPILLVYKKLTEEQKAYLATLSGNTFCVVGGTTAVPETLAEAVGAYDAVTRLAGKDRLDTSVLVAQKYFPDATTAVIAYGWDFPDGLCGGSLAYAIKSPLILTHSKEKLHEFTADYTTKAGLKEGYILGGSGLVDDISTGAIFGVDSGYINVVS